MSKLTPKQEKFCKEYLIDLNAGKAYKRAGYDGKGADQSASALLSNPKTQAYIAKLQGKVAEKFEIRLEDVLKRVQNHAVDGDNSTIMLKADDMLMKHLGAYTEKLEIKGEIEHTQYYAPKKNKDK